VAYRAKAGSPGLGVCIAVSYAAHMLRYALRAALVAIVDRSVVGDGGCSVGTAEATTAGLPWVHAASANAQIIAASDAKSVRTASPPRALPDEFTTSPPFRANHLLQLARRHHRHPGSTATRTANEVGGGQQPSGDRPPEGQHRLLMVRTLRPRSPWPTASRQRRGPAAATPGL
jgi:hypothetical protein